MTMRALLILGVGAMAVTACSNADEKPRKGKYKPEVQLTAFEMPGITEALKKQAEAQMQTSFASQVGGEQCVGATDKGEWKKLSGEISKGLGGTCNTVRDSSTDASVDVEVKCTGTQMGDVTTTIKGAAESESFGMDIMLNLEKLPTGGQGKLGMKVSAKRVGDC